MIQQRKITGNVLAMELKIRLVKGNDLSYDEVLEYASCLVKSNRENKGQVIKNFKQTIEDKLFNCFMEYLIKAMRQAAAEKHFIPERSGEKNQRVNVYSKCQTLGSGYETYEKYGRYLYFETDRMLSHQLCTLLDALLLCDEQVFIKIVKKSKNVLWPLRILECIGCKKTIEIDTVCKLANQLHPYQCGVLMAQMWDYLFIHRDENEQFNELIGCFVECIFQDIGSNQTLEMLAYQLNGLIGNALKNKIYIEKLIFYIGKCIVNYQVTGEQIKSFWLQNLNGKVNQEAKLLGLNLANEIEDALPDIALDLRMEILLLYPNIWKTHEGTSSKVFFNPDNVLNNIRNLASVMVKVKSCENLIAYLDEAEGIKDIKELDRLIYGHQYNKFYDEIELTMMHIGITLECLTLFIEQQKNVEISFVKNVCLTALDVLKRGIGKHLNNARKYMIQSISIHLGKLIHYYGEQFLDVVEKCIFQIHDVRTISYILMYVQDIKLKQKIDKHMQTLLIVQGIGLRSKELLNLANCLYENGQYVYSLELLNPLNREKVSKEEWGIIQSLTIYCYAFSGLQAIDIEEQIKNLEQSFFLLDRRYSRPIEEMCFKMLVIGWLLDRGKDYYDLLVQTYEQFKQMKEELLPIERKQLNQVFWINGESTTLVRLMSNLNNTDNRYKSYESEMDSLDKQLQEMRIEDPCNIIIQLWRNKIALQDDEIQQYYEQWREMIPQMPKILQDYAMKRMGISNEDIRYS